MGTRLLSLVKIVIAGDQAVSYLYTSQFFPWNAKWISTVENEIADKISRLKKLTPSKTKSSSSHDTYDYANLQQEHKELKACNSFQPSHKLVSLLSEILLTGNFYGIVYIKEEQKRVYVFFRNVKHEILPG